MTNVKKSGKKKIIAIIVVIAVLLVGTWLGFDFSKVLEFASGEPTETMQSAEKAEPTEGELILTMIDVGQADSFLFQQNGKTMLVDCGTRSGGDIVVEYLKNLGITKIEYVFGTHPHDDHMGGMYDVITNFEIGKIIIPDVEEGKVTSAWYEKLITEIVESEYNLEYAKEDTVYKLGDATIKILTQLTEYKSDLNNYSAIMKVSFGEMDIIMTGDAETIVEEVALNDGVNLDAEILKVGHHGSDTSSSNEFLDAVSPKYALISTEIGNKHEHPIKSVMDELKARDIEVYRTDESGTVILTITSNSVTFNTDPDDYLSGIEAEERYGK